MQPVLQDITKLLREKGLSEKQIADVTKQIVQVGYSLLYTKAIAAFSDKDMKAIEDASTDEEATAKIKELYKKHTGLDPDEEIRMYCKDFAERIQLEAKNDKTKSQPQPSS